MVAPPGSVIRAVPVGVLKMTDEKGGDEKIVAVPHEKIDAQHKGITNFDQLPQNLIDQITHFFERYKDLEHHELHQALFVPCQLAQFVA